ncbi:MAG TPA: nucleotidyltransferase [Candidatus Dormibacteraeota bacterium]|nr:nucleotidyltransferase [Candidatus Dormibacteraeota bacterium]
MPESERLTHGRMEAVLLRAVDALTEADIEHALMGGLASAAIGRSRHTHDVDIFVTPEDADAALEVLERAGFRTERTDPEWLYKAYWDETMVDVIFTSKGGVVFDEEMRAHRRPIEIRGRGVQALSAEDMLVIKALTNAEHVPRHWHDGLGILATNELDWQYLLWRARPHASRVASLLLYALSDGLALPQEPVRELFEVALGVVATAPAAEADHHVAARLRQALATDPRVHELHVSVVVSDRDVIVRGQVATPGRKQAIDIVLRELVGEGRVRNEVEVT